MGMGLALGNLAHQAALCVVAVVIVDMDHVIGVSADELLPRIPLLVFFIAVLCMFMHFQTTVQHFHLVGHGLAVHLQRSHRAESHRYGEAQKDRCLNPVLLALLQECCGL